MIERSWMRLLDSLSDNLKSKIQNQKLLGLSVIAFVLVVGEVVGQAQQTTKIPRIGFLYASSPSPDVRTRFLQGLRKFGYIEGQNITIEFRSAKGQFERLPVLAAELVRLNVDVIVTGGSTATRAAKEATSTIPIVMTQDNDPVASGFVASLARPGGNITGLSTLRPEISGKRLELLKEVVPGLSRVAVLGASDNPGNAQALKEVELAAGALKVQLQYLDIRSPKDIEPAFQEARKRVLTESSSWEARCWPFTKQRLSASRQRAGCRRVGEAAFCGGGRPHVLRRRQRRFKPSRR